MDEVIVGVAASTDDTVANAPRAGAVVTQATRGRGRQHVAGGTKVTDTVGIEFGRVLGLAGP